MPQIERICLNILTVIIYAVSKSYGAEVERVAPMEKLKRMLQLTSGPAAMTELPSIECLHLIVGHAR